MLFEIARDRTTYDTVLKWCRETLGYEPVIETTLNIFRVFCHRAEHVGLLEGRAA